MSETVMTGYAFKFLESCVIKEVCYERLCYEMRLALCFSCVVESAWPLKTSKKELINPNDELLHPELHSDCCLSLAYRLQCLLTYYRNKR